MTEQNKPLQREVNLAAIAALTSLGWKVERDNEDGGAFVLTMGGHYVVGGFHAYVDNRPTAESQAEITVDEAFSKVLVPALAAGNGQIPLGWVIEHEGGQWWDGERFQDMLSDGARVYTDDEKESIGEATSLDLGDDHQDSGWFPVYGHEADGCLTTEACSGVDTCPDCLDVRKSTGEDLADDPINGHNEQSEEDSTNAQSE